MRILVTGGAGFVGSVTVERLVDAGHEVTVLDSLVTGHQDATEPLAAFVEGSFGDRAILDRILPERGIEAVLHCGARSLVAQSMADPALYYHENVIGGIHLLDAMLAAGVDRIVFSSTAATYGEPERVPLRESDAARPVNTYGATKLAFEGAMRWYGAHGLRSMSLRYFNVAGASERHGEDHDPETHLIPNLLKAARSGRPATLFGDDYPTPDGTAIRDYIHVVDLAEAHVAALDLLARGGATTAVNVGTGRGSSVTEVLRGIEHVAGRPVPHRVVARRVGDPVSTFSDTTRSSKLLGWTARHDLDDILRSAYGWHLRQLDES